MPRYAPAPPGIRSAADTGNWTKWQLSAFADIAWQQFKQNKRTSSGLLIRGFGFQVSGGAPERSAPHADRSRDVHVTFTAHGHIFALSGAESTGCSAGPKGFKTDLLLACQRGC
jgi:hypothetical protein